MINRIQTRVIFSCVLLLIAVSATAAQKAQSRQVEFLKSTAEFIEKGGFVEGELEGVRETVYVLPAEAGRKMFIERIEGDVKISVRNSSKKNLTLKPVVGDNLWSVVFPVKGEYFLVFSDGNNARDTNDNFKFEIRIAVPVRDAAPPNANSPDAAMRRFIAAMLNTDTRAFLASFSERQPFKSVSPLNGVSLSVQYAKLAADVRNKDGEYWTYLERQDDGALDAFVDHFLDGRMWKNVGGNKFVPAGSDATAAHYVRWRKEGNKWVIAEISYP